MPTTSAASAVTGATGNVVEQYRYSDVWHSGPFFDGAGGAISSSAIGNSTLFTGRTYDEGSGLDHYRTRYLDPAAGRFISRDSIGIWGDEENLGNGFAYVGNNPASMLDPLGLAAGDGIGGVDVGLKKKPGGGGSDPPPPPPEDPWWCLWCSGLARGADVPSQGMNDELAPVRSDRYEYAASINTSRSNIKEKAPLALASPVSVDSIRYASAASINTSRSNIKDKASIALTSPVSVDSDGRGGGSFYFLNLRMLTARRELTGVQHNVATSCIKAKRTQEVDTEAVKSKTDASDAARSEKKLGF